MVELILGVSYSPKIFLRPLHRVTAIRPDNVPGKDVEAQELLQILGWDVSDCQALAVAQNQDDHDFSSALAIADSSETTIAFFPSQAV